MARYQAPPDPREPGAKVEKKRDPGEPVPWRYLGLGLVVAVIGMVIGLLILRAFLFREPLPVSPLEPTVIILTAPPRATATPLPDVPTPTAVPTFTPIPTPDTAVTPEQVTPGFYAQVANTDGIGVTVRGGPSTNNVPLTVAAEGTILLVLDGPEEGNDFLWWQVRLDDGTEGWVAGDFLIPAVEP